MNLIEIKKAKRIVFVGDTHGDLEATQRIIKNYLKKGNKIVFLGDYVDRGPFSKENLDLLLKTKLKKPDQVYLLQGNHEGHSVLKFFPAEFWESLDEKTYKKYSTIVTKFPLVVMTNNIIALHGALPDVNDLSKINKIEIGTERWRQITWGDFYDEKGEYLGIDPFSGRPKFGRDYFLKLMKRFGKRILIRSHQPGAPHFMFDNRCLTIFTSSAYTRERTIAIFDTAKKIKTARDLDVLNI
jgi:predicted phosphodiesterase